MLRKVENCPLVATLRNGTILLINHDVMIKGNIHLELTVESIAEISAELFQKGIDIIAVSIDEARMKYVEIDLL